MNWRQRALCRDEDPEIWFPVGTTGAAVERQVAEAKGICSECSVESDCLNYAIETRQDGIWGGTTDDERAVMQARPRLGVWTS